MLTPRDAAPPPPRPGPPLLQNNPIVKLCFQLIPAMLGQANFAGAGCAVPADITANIAAANALIANRVVPPIGNGCPAGVSSCTQLTNNQVTTIADVLGEWNRKGECKT